MVLFIVGVSLQAFFAFKQDMMEDAIVQKTVNGFTLIEEAIIAFRAERGTWPATLNTLSTYLPNWANANGVGRAYTLAAEGTGLVISTRLETATQQLRVASAFPTNGATIPDTFEVSMGIPIPGFENVHNEFLRRSAGLSQPLTGDLYLTDRSIRGVNFVSTRALRFRTTAAPNTACSPRRTLAISSTDQLLICDAGGKWQPYKAGGVKLKKGSVRSGVSVFPPPGYSKNQCVIATNGKPQFLGRSGHESYGTYTDEISNGWRIRAGTATNNRGSLPATGNFFVNYQMICGSEIAIGAVSTPPSPTPLPQRPQSNGRCRVGLTLIQGMCHDIR